MYGKVLNYVYFILYFDRSFELVTCDSLEDLADVLIDEFDLIEQIFEVDCY